MRLHYHLRGVYIADMVRKSISNAAFEAIVATLLGNVRFENKRALC